MSNVSNPIQACNEIFMRPRGVFEALKENNNWSWIPFIIVTVCSLLPMFLYYSAVDQTFHDELMRNSHDFMNLSPAEIELQLEFLKVDQMATFGLIGGAIGILVVNAIIAVYYKLVTQSDETNVQGFTDWYGAMWWIGMPVVIGSLLSVVAILFSNSDGLGQMSPSIASVTSLSYIFGVGMESKWYGVLSSIRIESLWSLYIGAVAIGTWTRFEFSKCITLAAIPYVLIYGIMILFTIF